MRGSFIDVAHAFLASESADILNSFLKDASLSPSLNLKKILKSVADVIFRFSRASWGLF